MDAVPHTVLSTHAAAIATAVQGLRQMPAHVHPGRRGTGKVAARYCSTRCRTRAREASGTPPELTREKIAHAREAIDSGEQSITGMAKLVDIHRTIR